MTGFFTELRERRVVPAIGVYVASAWVVVEILDRLVERYLLSPTLTDVVFWGLFSLLPAVSLVAWSYGRPGKDTATRAQKIGVPINIVLTVGMLFALFGGKDLGPTAERVSVVNEEGVEEELVVPDERYRRRLAVFFFDNDSDDGDLDWIQYAATELLTQDLQQDPYLAAASPYGNWATGYYSRLKAAGYEDATGVPASLLREVARDSNRRYFVEGSVLRDADEIVLVTRLWDVESMGRVAEVTEQGLNLPDIIDRTSIALREALDVPSVGQAGHEDLPLAETYGESESALKAYIAGLNTRMMDNDIPGAIAQLDAALEEDPRFVMAMFAKGVMLADAGDLPSAARVLTGAQELDYRLPSSDRTVLRMLIYRSTGQTDKLMNLLRLQVQLTGEPRWHNQLAFLLMVNDQRQEAREHFAAALAKDASNVPIYLTLSDLDRSLGDMEGAIENARRYQELRPNDMGASIKLGDLLRDTGDLDGAEARYAEAQLLDSDAVDPLLYLHIIAARRGDDATARRFLEEALDVARTPAQVASVHLTAGQYEGRLARIDAAVAQMRAAEPFVAESQAPFVVAISVHTAIVAMYLQRDDMPASQAVYAEAQALLPQPPLNQLLEAIAATLAARDGRFEAARSHLANFEAVIEQMGLGYLAFQVPILRAEISHQEERDADAARNLEQALAMIDESFIAGQLYGAIVPELLADLASLQISAGDLDAAESTLERGFRIDPFLPRLWLARATLQKERGQDQLAQASLGQVLAFWSEADPEHVAYQEALALVEALAQSGP